MNNRRRGPSKGGGNLATKGEVRAKLRRKRSGTSCAVSKRGGGKSCSSTPPRGDRSVGGSGAVSGEIPAEGMRLQKWLAEAGVCSRRQGERWMEAGRVALNGKTVSQMGTRVMPGDRVVVDGKAIQREEENRFVMAYYKPSGLLCARKDDKGRRTIYDEIRAPGRQRMVSVGRLDYNTEGLLLLTNDGALAHRLTHPSRQVPRVYRARVHGIPTGDFLAQLKIGITLEDGPTGPLDVVLDRENGANRWYTLTLREGRNRIVRRIFEHFGMEVSRLLRVAYGGVELGALQRGKWRLLEADEIQNLTEI
ncbi:MAG: rRNA pseudouridine synthase [Magnetococcales bacterium]|nr:rRNA pseudouridine synthase [Magnetococcales bacterium]